MAEEEIDYESDPEEAKVSLKMRRREASDDEEEDEEGVADEGEEHSRGNSLIRKVKDSEEESEGGAADYEDDELEEEEDYDLDDYSDGVVEAGYGERGDGREGYDVVSPVAVEVGKDGMNEGGLMEEKGVNSNIDNGENDNVADGQQEEEKEVEPFAVPTAGAFYMHDDRFRDNVGGRNRRMLGGRKIWESRDDRKWGHDKFEELTVQERHLEDGRRGSRGRYRGRGRNRGSGRGYARENRPGENSDNSTQNRNNQNNSSKSVRGRGPRRYQPIKNNNELLLPQNKDSGKFAEKPSYISSSRASAPPSNADADMVLPRKQVSSNLSVASPPFYPSGSSSKGNTYPHKRDVQPRAINRNGQASVINENSMEGQSTTMMRRKNIVDSIGMDKLCIDDSSLAMSGKLSNTSQVQLSGLSSANSTQAQMRGQRRGVTSMRQMVYQPIVSNNQDNRVSPPSLPQNAQRNPSQYHAQSSAQARVPSGTQGYSPPKAVRASNALESKDMESSSESSKSKTALVAKGKGDMQGSGMGSFLYGGTQVMGTSGNTVSGRGDQNFPTFMPVMQFRGQHPGGIGVPAVGMAFPGYVGQPQPGGRGNSEMTWLPVLAGAAGALGANFCPPYMNVDGSYHARPSGQPSSSSKETNAIKVGNDWNPVQRPDHGSDDHGQRPNKPRRYTEMKFDQ